MWRVSGKVVPLAAFHRCGCAETEVAVPHAHIKNKFRLLKILRLKYISEITNNQQIPLNRLITTIIKEKKKDA